MVTNFFLLVVAVKFRSFSGSSRAMIVRTAVSSQTVKQAFIFQFRTLAVSPVSSMMALRPVAWHNEDCPFVLAQRLQR